MVFNADKCEVTFFSTNSHEANWQPTISANNTRLHHNPLPKFLGVTLDRLLTFGPHIQSISTKAPSRCRVLASLTSKEWGWRKDQLIKVYKALQLTHAMQLGGIGLVVWWCVHPCHFHPP